MTLFEYISLYNLNQILSIEEQDRQFVVLKQAWDNISKLFVSDKDRKLAGNLFVFVVLQNSLISYQIAGSGELRWQEFSEKLANDFVYLFDQFIAGKDNLQRFYQLMINSKYNKRLYNLKLNRLKRFNSDFFRSGLALDLDVYSYFNDMNSLWLDLSKVMKVDKNSKTIVFAVKMFGYAARIVFGKVIYYPMSIPIPVDSRIRKIFCKEFGVIPNKEIIEISNDYSFKLSIPPLHLDSLLWVKR